MSNLGTERGIEPQGELGIELLDDGGTDGGRECHRGVDGGVNRA